MKLRHWKEPQRAEHWAPPGSPGPWCLFQAALSRAGHVPSAPQHPCLRKGVTIVQPLGWLAEARAVIGRLPPSASTGGSRAGRRHLGCEARFQRCLVNVSVFGAFQFKPLAVTVTLGVTVQFVLPLKDVQELSCDGLASCSTCLRGAGVDGEVTCMGAASCCPRAGPGPFREDLVKSHLTWLSCNQERLKGPSLRPGNPYSHPSLPSLSSPGTLLGGAWQGFQSITLLSHLLTALGYHLTDSSCLISHLHFLVLGKTAPQLLCWISLMGKDFSVCPPLWSPCPTLPHSLSLFPLRRLCFSFGFQ